MHNGRHRGANRGPPVRVSVTRSVFYTIARLDVVGLERATAATVLSVRRGCDPLSLRSA